MFITAAQVEVLAAHLDATTAPHGLLVRFATYTGLRAAERRGLRARDLNLKAGHVDVRQTLQRTQGEWGVGTPKWRRPTREVPIHDPKVLSAVRQYLFAHPNRADPDVLLWPGRMPGTHVVDFNRVFDVASFRRNYLRPALRTLGMPEMRFRNLRHTFASLARSGNESAYIVSRWLGHANVTTTDAIYAYMCPSDHESHVDRFEKVVAEGLA